MIASSPQCENCRTWWHRACAQHPPEGDRPFYCSGCLHRISLVGGKVVEYYAGPEDKTMDLMIGEAITSIPPSM